MTTEAPVGEMRLDIRATGQDASGLQFAVAIELHGFKSPETAQEFAAACNVFIATPSALGASEPEVRAELLKGFAHLFIDARRAGHTNVIMASARPGSIYR